MRASWEAGGDCLSRCKRVRTQWSSSSMARSLRVLVDVAGALLLAWVEACWGCERGSDCEYAFEYPLREGLA